MKKAKLFMMLALLVMGVSNVFAQNVTVRPDNGSTLPALKVEGSTDTFYGWGGFATWKHEQLSLTITTGDSDNNSGVNANGQLQNPANDIFVSAADANGKKYLQLGKGSYHGMDTYITVALPKGYRFTGYRIKFHRINRPQGGSTDNNNSGNISFGETDKTFEFSTVEGTVKEDIAQSDHEQYTISREDKTEMDNVLYFCLSNGKQTGRAYIQIDEFELYFTAEADYLPITSTTSVSGRTAVDISFPTSKMDYGRFRRYNQNGTVANGNNGRIAYRGVITDLNANLTLYEAGSVRTITAAENDFDGIAGDIVNYQSGGSISSSGDYFELDASKHKNKSQVNGKDFGIYYIETPVWVESVSAVNGQDNPTAYHKNPIGYRIVGATFDYEGGTYVPAVGKIIFHDDDDGYEGGSDYGLNYFNGQYNYNYQTEWRIDKDGYIYFEGHYLQVNGTNIEVTTTKPAANVGTFKIVGDKICLKNDESKYIGWQKVEVTTTNEETGETITTVNRKAIITEDEDHISTYVEISPSSGGDGTVLPEFTLILYDKTGENELRRETVNGTKGSLTIYPEDGFNNDAIKFGIIGKGRIKGNLVVQALDPYIESLNIVCSEEGGNGGKLTQHFSASDFSVSGKAFDFYVPTSFTGKAVFTFEDLYSKYGDNDYYEANNDPELHARYYFIGSTYGNYDGNDVYVRYNNTAHRNASYTTKVICEEPGKTTYTFNNAATVTNSSNGFFMENPFTVAKYGTSNFGEFSFTQTEIEAEQPKTAYLFVGDETRYNIAPTTATQHVYYAYYKMVVTMHMKNYDPVLNWKKIYNDNDTFYGDASDNMQKKSMWGLNVTTTETMDDNGTHSGYLTVSQLLTAIQNGVGKTNAPAGKDQILYIDAHDLQNLVADGTNTVSSIKTGLAQNALVYLPYNNMPSLDNFAYNTVSDYEATPNFRGNKDIVITDRHPFFAPYDIQVDAQRTLYYDRKLTPAEDYSNVVNATVMLPFTIKVKNGVHTNADGPGSTFTMSKMNAINALSKVEKYDNEAKGYFTAITGTRSEANSPYVVTVNGKQNGDFNFNVRESGSTVVATPWIENDTNNGLQFDAAKNGTVDGTTYEFTPTGTYKGMELANAKSASPAVFYFSKDAFVTTRTLGAGKSLKVLPFRSYFTYPAPAGAKLTKFHIVFGDNDELDNTTGINEVAKNADLAIIPGKGEITILAKVDKDVTIHAVNGMTVDKCNLRAGETRTVAIPAGVYVINGVKMVVK